LRAAIRQMLTRSNGNAMPQSNHGGPGRAGGGQELGGLRALAFYHRYASVQAPPSVLAHLQLPQAEKQTDA